MPDADVRRDFFIFLSDLTGPLLPVQGEGSSWRRTVDGTLIGMKYSRLPTPWYGLSADGILRWAQYPRAFIVFMFSQLDFDEALVVPAHDVRQLVDEAKRQREGFRPGGNGNYNFHLEHKDGAYWFRESPAFDTSMYLGKYGLLGHFD